MSSSTRKSKIPPLVAIKRRLFVLKFERLSYWILGLLLDSLGEDVDIKIKIKFKKIT